MSKLLPLGHALPERNRFKSGYRSSVVPLLYGCQAKRLL